MLLTVGDLVEDVLVLLPGPPAVGTDTTTRIVRRRGGSAANVAAAAARAGYPARLLARVGDDDLGVRLVMDLDRLGVDTSCIQRHGETGSIVVLVDPDGERTMLTDRGASAELQVDVRALHGVTAVHVTTYGLDVAEPLLRAAEGLRSIDASSVGFLAQRGADHWRRRFTDLAPDVLFADAGEAAFLDPLPEVPLVIVKDGGRPARIHRPGQSVVEVPAEQVDVVDTTGAGDAFAAGWLGATLDGADPVEATRVGHRLAADVVRTVGAAS